MWDLPGPGLEPVSSALAGGFLTTVPPGKPRAQVLINFVSLVPSPLVKVYWLNEQLASNIS